MRIPATGVPSSLWVSLEQREVDLNLIPIDIINNLFYWIELFAGGNTPI